MKTKETPPLVHEVQLRIAAHKREIEMHQSELHKLAEVLKILHNKPSPGITFRNAEHDEQPIYIRKKEVLAYMEKNSDPVQNADIVSFYHPTLYGKERESMIRRVSVIFFNLERDELVEKEKREGIKGNFYTLKNK